MFSEITVILQGAVVPGVTAQAIQAVKKVLPGAFVILSTWDTESAEGLSCDKVIKGEAPLSPVEYVQGRKSVGNNTNRMILGVKQALGGVHTKYILKLRTDIILEDASFLNYWDKYPKRVEEFQIFQHRVLNYYLFTPRFCYRCGRKAPTLFHPSDWMFLGLSEDIKKLFDIDLQPDPAYSMWWKEHIKNPAQIDCWPGAIFRYAPEQYLFYQGVKKSFPNIQFSNYMDISREKEQLSRQIMVNNFVILDYRQWHIKMFKYQHLIGSIPYGQTSHSHWQADYKRYCEPNFIISWKDWLFQYSSFNIGEIIKTKQIEWEKKLVINLFPSLYLAHVQKKYANSPAKLKQKQALFDCSKQKYIYPEDIPQ